MSRVLNRTTKQYRKFADTPYFPVSDWIINPDMSAVGDFPSIYWVITGDIVTLLDEVGRDAVDFALSAQALTDERAEQKARVDDEKLIKAMAVVIMKEINLLRTKHSLSSRTISQFRNAIKNQIDQE